MILLSGVHGGVVLGLIRFNFHKLVYRGVLFARRAINYECSLQALTDLRINVNLRRLVRVRHIFYGDVFEAGASLLAILISLLLHEARPEGCAYSLHDLLTHVRFHLAHNMFELIMQFVQLLVHFLVHVNA